MMCKDCGQDFAKLYAPGKGQCQKCYKREWERNARKDPVLGAKIRSRANRTYHRNKGAVNVKMKVYREQVHFDGKRQEALALALRKCSRCGKTCEEKDLTVHHKDRKGRGSDSPNNVDENLEPLCRACHCKEHALELAKARGCSIGDGNVYEWALGYPACTECGTTSRKHKGHGRCVNCYKRLRTKKVKGYEDIV